MKLINYIIFFTMLINRTSYAESFVYISDQVDIPMRSQKQLGDNIIKILPSGTKLTMLQVTKDGWTEVKFKNTIGWIVSRYLLSNIPAKKQLKKLTQKYNANKILINTQKQKNKELLVKIKLLNKNNTQLIIENGKVKAAKKHMEQTYQDTLKLEHTNNKLVSEILHLKTEIQLLNNNNTEQQTNSLRNWFITGAGILFFGILIGLFIHNFIKLKRRY